MAEKLVTVQIPKTRAGGFCWDGKDYEPGDTLKLPANYATIYASTGKVVILKPQEKQAEK